LRRASCLLSSPKALFITARDTGRYDESILSVAAGYGRANIVEMLLKSFAESSIILMSPTGLYASNQAFLRRSS
jgi:hypothetical protein